MPTMIDTSVMPGDTMDPDAIDTAAGELRGVGTKVSTQGGTVLTSWQKISGSYDAPEENTLFHAMNPVKTAAEKFGTDTGSVATALEAFAEEVRTIKAAVVQIRSEAATFRSDVADGVEKKSATRAGVSTRTIEWHEDQSSVNTNNDLVSRTNDQQEALWRAERTCANAIRGLVGLGPLSAMSESNPNGYGVDDIPDGTEMPWGAKVERTENCGEKVVHGVANGAGGMIGGVANLFGFKYTGDGLWDQWDWEWDWSLGNAGEAWTGVGKFAVGAAVLSNPAMWPTLATPGPVNDFFRDSAKTAGGAVVGMVGIDIYAEDPLHKWKEEGWQTLGESVFNVATIVVAPTKVGNLGKVGRAGEMALKVTDPLYLATRAAEGLKSMLGPTAESLARLNRAVDLDTGVKISNDIDIPAVNRDGVNPDLPNTNGPDVDAPPARDYTDQQERHDGNDTPDQSPATPDREPAVAGGRDGDGDYDPEAEGSAGGGTDLSPGLAHQSFEDTSHGYGPDTQTMDAGTQPVDFGTTRPTDLGRYGEELTRQDLTDRGYTIVSEQAQIQLPNGKYFKPDFIAYDSTTQSLILVESKMGSGAKFTPNQLVGYEHYGKGVDPVQGRSFNTNRDLLRDLQLNRVQTRLVTRVEVYRWNTEIVPSAALRARAGVP